MSHLSEISLVPSVHNNLGLLLLRVLLLLHVLLLHVRRLHDVLPGHLVLLQHLVVLLLLPGRLPPVLDLNGRRGHRCGRPEAPGAKRGRLAGAADAAVGGEGLLQDGGVPLLLLLQQRAGGGGRGRVLLGERLLQGKK